MTLQDLGAIGDLVGGVGVILSLVYVASQIRQNSRLLEQNSRQLQASMYFATNDSFVRWWALLATDGDTASVWRRGLRGESSSVEERARFQAPFASLMSTYENNFVQQQLGAVHRDTLKVSRESLRRLFDAPGGRDWWERHSRHHLAPEFREAVARELGLPEA